MFGTRDVVLKDSSPKTLLFEKHEKYLKQYSNDETGTEQILAEYIKMSGMYWGLNALYIMQTLDLDSIEVSKALIFVKTCQTAEGGFAAAPRHDAHILHTLSAVQILKILDRCNPEHLDIDRCVSYISSLQQNDGSFAGDKWGEIDTRFSLCALAALKILNRLDAIDLEKAVEFVISCWNQIDGGFGRMPGSESHTAYVYCCVGSLAIANRLDLIDTNQLSWWLSERQLPSGGLNGRPEKLPDLCYSWWCLATLKMVNRMHLIDHQRLLNFILACQDDEQGGMSDRPGNWVDPYHTMFGLASLSLICHHYKTSEISAEQKFHQLLGEICERLRPVNPMLCLPENCMPEERSQVEAKGEIK